MRSESSRYRGHTNYCSQSVFGHTRLLLKEPKFLITAISIEFDP